MSWTRPIGRHAIVLILFFALMVMNLVSAGIVLADSEEGGGQLPLIAIREAVYIVLLILYLKGWKPARQLFGAAITVFSAQALTLFLPNRQLPLGLILPILSAALLSDWRGILATGLFLLAVVIGRNGLEAMMAAPIPLLVFCFCVFLVMLLWLSLDAARKEAVARAGELERSASKLRFQSELIERAGQSIIAGDKDGRILFWNEAATRLHGWTADEMIGKTDVRGLLELGEEERLRTQAEFRAGRSYSLDSFSSRKDGSRFPALVNVSPLFDEGGEVSGWVSVGVDISELREAEEEVRRLNSSLEAKVEERTAQLSEANASLSRALAELKAADAKLVLAGKMSSLGLLAAGIAHEVNTPLGAIGASARVLGETLSRGLLPFLEEYQYLGEAERSLLVEVLGASSKAEPLLDPSEERKLRRSLEAELAALGVEDGASIAIDLVLLGDEGLARRLLPLAAANEGRKLLGALEAIVASLRAGQIIEAAVEQASQVVRALRLYVRQDYSDGPVESDIRAELETVLTLFRNKTKGEVAIERNYAADSVVQGRPSELNQVWINLIDNALEAMSYKGSLRVGTEERGGWLAVMVGDSGPGIPSEIGEKVFEPFFTTRKEGAGIGLGLDIARRVIESHGGSIAFASEPGNTVFTVLLPRGR